MENKTLTNFATQSDKKKWEKPTIEIIDKNIIESGLYPWTEGVNSGGLIGGIS